MAGLAKKVRALARGSPAGVRGRAKVARMPGCAWAAIWSVREGGEGRGPPVLDAVARCRNATAR